MRHVILIALSLLLSLATASQRPSPDAQKLVIDAAREIAIHYSAQLPNFICTEKVARNDTSRTLEDHLTIQLSFFGQKEKYKLVARNGFPSTQQIESLGGLITGGEFGSLLLGVFDPSASAEFQWKSASNLRKRPVNIYTYRIARASSHYVVGGRVAGGSMAETTAGYHGDIFIDNETSRVLRFTAYADDIPREFGMLKSSVEVDYDFVNIAGQSYLLPSHSYSNMERGHRKMSNSIAFVDYKKFEAETNIDFDK